MKRGPQAVRRSEAEATIDPLARLREEVTALEAAMALTLAEPKKRPVHALRTSTRRIEAQLILLGEVGGRAALPRPSAKTGRLLKKIRKAAGTVRDLDVQRKLLKDLRKTTVQRRVRDEASDLRSELKHERQVQAARLVKELEGHALKLGPVLEDLLERDEHAGPPRLTPEQLTELTRQWFERQVQGLPRDRSDDSLHAIRKAAKLARYMAEAGGHATAGVADEFEQMQQSGGEWHDALLLGELAKRHLGKRSELGKVYDVREQEALTDYLERVDRL